jgi:hypothetical protein
VCPLSPILIAADVTGRIITDRYALPSGSPIDPHACNTSAQTWCGGTWAGITQNLDYIQAAGFTAIWISPVSQNYVGPRTPYGDPYHGYWVQDASQLNARFGSADDLKALVAAVHQRGMYIMVDVVVNNVMALGTTPDYSQYMFKDAVSICAHACGGPGAEGLGRPTITLTVLLITATARARWSVGSATARCHSLTSSQFLPRA